MQSSKRAAAWPLPPYDGFPVARGERASLQGERAACRARWSPCCSLSAPQHGAGHRRPTESEERVC